MQGSCVHLAGYFDRNFGDDMMMKLVVRSLPEITFLVNTGYRLFKEHGDPQISSENRSGDCYIAALMRTMFMGSGSNLFLRKSVVDEVNGYDETFTRNQDIEFLVRVLEKYKLAH